MLYLWVAIGGAIGSVARFWFGNVAAATLGAAFPWGTLMINVLGSFVISFFSGLTGMGHRFSLPNDARILVTVGVCGGFTTFSSFSLQTVELARDGQAGRAALYVAASMIICIVACAFGVWAASAINQQMGARA
jgi:fluoride exporter